MRRTLVAALTATATATSAFTGTPGAAATEPEPEPEPHPAPEILAEFEGEHINLADGWGDATACHADDEGTRCYRTALEMFDTEALFTNGGALAARACSGDLLLYRGANYTDDVLSLSTQSVLLNLASYGFNNDTSSFKVGPCTSRLYDSTTGSGLYPGTTTANTASPTMASGWDNRIGSAYIT